MGREYRFRDLVKYSGLTENEAKTLVAKGIIRPDVKGTTGTGDQRRFGFLDVFEGCVARLLTRLPGGTPIFTINGFLEWLRFYAVSPDLNPPGSGPGAWGWFLNPETREPGARFWLNASSPSDRNCVLDRDGFAALSDRDGALVILRLDTLVLALEHEAGDHCTAAEIRNAWTKQGKRTVPRPEEQTALEHERHAAAIRLSQRHTSKGAR